MDHMTDILAHCLEFYLEASLKSILFQFSSTSSPTRIARFRKLILLSRWNERRITTCYHHWSKGFESFDRSCISFRYSDIWKFWKLLLIVLESFWVCNILYVAYKNGTLQKLSSIELWKTTALLIFYFWS